MRLWPLLLPALTACNIEAAPPAGGKADSAEGCTESTFFFDDDNDGYGTTDARIDACEQPAGYVSTGGDCDDTSAAVSPVAPELCSNSVDDDCDGNVDEDDAANTTIWFIDTDGDGYGDDATGTPSCTQPDGTTAVGGDCDETNVAINPGAVETCDGVDTNCSGDEGDAPGPRTYYADTDGDGYGNPDNPLAGCTAFTPGGYVTNDGDCEDAMPEVNEGAAGEVCHNGVDDDCNESPDQCAFEGSFGFDTLVYPAVAVGSGQSLALADVTGDVSADLLLGAPLEGTANTGEVLVYAGPLTATYTYNETAVLLGEESPDNAGLYVAADGDLDADGTNDILVSAPYSSASAHYAGAVYVVYGDGLSPSLSLSLADAVLEGEAENDSLGNNNGAYSGSATMSGDADGDGLPDVLIGAVGHDGVAGADSGAAYLISAPGGTVNMADATATFEGAAADDSAAAVAFIGDGNGDGYDDFAVGATHNSDAVPLGGAVYIERGGADLSGVASLAGADAIWTGASASGYAGYSLAGVGDVTGDGLADVGIGNYANTVAWVVSAGSTGTASLGDADITLTGVSGSQMLGNADFNDDGATDFVLSGGASTCAWLLYGPLDPGSYTAADADAYTAEGGTMPVAGDINGDSVDDLLTLGQSGQIVYTYFGGGY